MSKTVPTAEELRQARIATANRGVNIRIILDSEFPGGAAPPPLGSGASDRAGWEASKQRRDARQKALIGLSNEEIHAIAEPILQFKEAQREARMPFAVEPDLAYWQRREKWNLIDAAIILNNLDPRQALGLVMRTAWRAFAAYSTEHISEDRDATWNNFLVTRDLSRSAHVKLTAVRDVIETAQQADRPTLAFEGIDTVNRRSFLAWADGLGYRIPEAIRELMRPEPTRAALLAENARLQAEVNSLQATLNATPTRWPWGDYTSPGIELLADAVAHHLKDGTLPKRPGQRGVNERVKHWLIEKGMEKTLARYIASVICGSDPD